jgi:hypothetical protein
MAMWTKWKRKAAIITSAAPRWSQARAGKLLSQESKGAAHQPSGYFSANPV